MKPCGVTASRDPCARQALGEDAYDAAFACGTSLEPERAVDLL
ncbi:hypothetical protein [Nonomuraea candida]|nr:hypothetical protein [Nonomuraea candida]